MRATREVIFRKLTALCVAAAMGVLASCAAPTSYMGIDLISVQPEYGIRDDIQKLAIKAQSGDKWSQFKLALFFEEGRWIEQDIGRALELYRKASKNTPLRQTAFIPGAAGGEAVTVAIGTSQDGLKLAEYRHHLLRSRNESQKPAESFAELNRLAMLGNEFAAIYLIRGRLKYQSVNMSIDGSVQGYENTLFRGDVKQFEWPNGTDSIGKFRSINPVAILEYCSAFGHNVQSSMCSNKEKLRLLNRIVRLDQAFPNCLKETEGLPLNENYSSYDCMVSYSNSHLNFELPNNRKNLIWNFFIFVSAFEKTGELSGGSVSLIRELFANNFADLFSYTKDSLYLSETPSESLLTSALVGMFVSLPSQEICEGNHCRFWWGACSEFRTRFRQGKEVQHKYVSNAEKAICAAQKTLPGREKVDHPSALKKEREST